MARSDESYLDSLLHSLSDPGMEPSEQEQAIDNDSISHGEKIFPSKTETTPIREPFVDSGNDELDIDDISFDDIDIDGLFQESGQETTGKPSEEVFEEEEPDEFTNEPEEDNGLKLGDSDRRNIESMLSSQEEEGQDWEEEPQAELLEGLQDAADLMEETSGITEDMNQKKRPFFADIADPLLTEEQKSLFPKSEFTAADEDELSSEDMRALKEALLTRNTSFSESGEEGPESDAISDKTEDYVEEVPYEESLSPEDGEGKESFSENLDQGEIFAQEEISSEAEESFQSSEWEQLDSKDEALPEDVKLPVTEEVNLDPWAEEATQDMEENTEQEENAELVETNEETADFSEELFPAQADDEYYEEAMDLSDAGMKEDGILDTDRLQPPEGEAEDIPALWEEDTDTISEQPLPVGKDSEFLDEEEPDMDLLNALLENMNEEPQDLDSVPYEGDEIEDPEPDNVMTEEPLQESKMDMEEETIDPANTDYVPEPGEDADLLDMLAGEENIDREEEIEVAKDSTSSNQEEDDLLSLDSMLDELGTELEEPSDSDTQSQSPEEPELEEDILGLFPDGVEEDIEETGSEDIEEDTPKKKGVMEKLFANVPEDPEKAAAKAAKMREKAKAKGLDLDENGNPLPKPKKTKEEIKAEKEAKKKEQEEIKKQKKAEANQKKAAKAAANAEKKKAKEEQKKKKAVEEVVEVDEGRINRVGATIIFTFFGILTILIIFGTNGFSYQRSIREAETYFTGKMYEEAYKEIRGISVKSRDQELYDRITTVMYVEKQWNSYQNYTNMELYPEALDSLLKGIQRYDTYVKTAKELGVKNDLDSIRNQILKELLTTYQLSEEDAYHIINSGSQEDYSQKVFEAASIQ